MSTEAVKWAMDDAPMLLTGRGKPDTTARHVLQALAEHAHKDGSGAHPSLLRLQYRTGYDRRTVQRALRRLQDAGLITPEGNVNGRTKWRLALRRVRPASDWAELEAEEEGERAAAAERKRRSRAHRVTHSNDVTVTHSESVTHPDVTHSESGRHALQMRDVTHSASGRHALNAALTINQPSLQPPENQPPDGRRPTTGSTGDPESGSAAPQDEPTEKVSTADVRAVIAGLPQPVRAGLAKRARHTPPAIVATIRTELARGLTADRLIARATDRWHLRGYSDDPAGIRRPIGVADALLRNDCTSPVCDDGTDMWTGQPCRTCERAREDHTAERTAS